jgi:ABC-type multidrug transport system ATPase subunit
LNSSLDIPQSALQAASTPSVLELHELALAIGPADAEQTLLSEVTLRVPKGHFAAILGPSGCGKSTLLKAIAGIREHTLGTIHWKGRDLATEKDMDPHEIGYVPQFSIAHELLTVEESVESALRLRVADLPEEERHSRIESVLRSVDLEEIGDRRVSLLSGGQKRRLALAMEMVSSPQLLLCDEVTSGLDPKSEDEIVKLMHDLARADDRIVLSVTHSLQHVRLYDSVIVLYQGVLAYHGSPEFLTHYFGIQRPEELYPRLAERKAADWQRSWHKYRDTYYEHSRLPAGVPAMAEAEPAEKRPPTEEEEIERLREIVERKAKEAEENAEDVSEGPPPPAMLPGIATQFAVLLARRWKLFFRDRGQLLLQAALLFGFPCLVVIFAIDGLPDVKSLADSGIGTLFDRARQEADSLRKIANVGTLVSGLIMFQVILLALMGSNNAAREIAAERHLLEKEKFAGLSPLAYVASKVMFLAILVLAQSVWMAVFVNFFVGFQGSFGMQVLSLVLINAAMTSVCLGISAWSKTAEQASLLSIYLVGFQLPLSGAVLALPKAIAGITQIFIASYWGWSGFIRSMDSTRYYDAVKSVTQTEPAHGALCGWVLLAHVLFGLLLAYSGSRNSRWE